MSGATQTFLDGRVVLHSGDCLDVLDSLPAHSVDAVITDPPYHFNTIVKRFGGEASAPAQFGTDGTFASASAGFMGKSWDGGDVAFRPETWAKVLRVLKPGGHLAAFSAPKCVHKMGVAIELAGFEMRDRIINLFDPSPHVMAYLESQTPAQADALFRLLDHFGPLGEAFWTFGSGFPKSHDVSKAIDRMKGARREKVRVDSSEVRNPTATGGGKDGAEGATRPWIEAALERGFHEKDGDTPATPEAAQWAGWGTALKPAYEPILIARAPLAEKSVAAQVLATGTGAINIDAARIETDASIDDPRLGGNGAWKTSKAQSGETVSLPRGAVTSSSLGRFPANLAHDGSDAVLAWFPDTTSTIGIKGGTSPNPMSWNTPRADGNAVSGHADSGSAARFFYTSKADAHDRVGSGHPTVKPLDLMQWLARMLCPAGGTILDPFAGTGTTAEAAFREGFSAVLIEREAEYRADIARRMALVLAGPATRSAESIKAKAKRRGEADHGPLFGGLDTPPRDGRQIYGEFADEQGRRRT